MKTASNTYFSKSSSPLLQSVETSLCSKNRLTLGYLSAAAMMRKDINNQLNWLIPELQTDTRKMDCSGFFSNTVNCKEVQSIVFKLSFAKRIDEGRKFRQLSNGH